MPNDAKDRGRCGADLVGVGNARFACDLLHGHAGWHAEGVTQWSPREGAYPCPCGRHLLTEAQRGRGCPPEPVLAVPVAELLRLADRIEREHAVEFCACCTTDAQHLRTLAARYS